MRLYHHPLSSNARRAVMTAHHLGVDVELVLIDLSRGAQRAPSFVRMNPNAKVPVLEDGDLVLWESHAIMQYLADITPGQTLYPADARARADVNRWLFWCAHHFAPSVGVLGWERIVKKIVGAGDPDPAAEARGEALVAGLAKILDGHLAGKEWIAQGQLTLADLSVATPLMIAGPARLPLAGCPNLIAWLERVQALDAWKRTSPGDGRSDHQPHRAARLVV
jgi:glutathione S-transferase